jgi:hypothetical protein
VTRLDCYTRQTGGGKLAGILIIDDYQPARTTIKGLLGWHELHVCGEAKDGKEAVEKVKTLDLLLFWLRPELKQNHNCSSEHDSRRRKPLDYLQVNPVGPISKRTIITVNVKLRVQYKDGPIETLDISQSISILEGVELDRIVCSDGTEYYFTKDGHYDGWGKGVPPVRGEHKKKS